MPVPLPEMNKRTLRKHAASLKLTQLASARAGLDPQLPDSGDICDH